MLDKNIHTCTGTVWDTSQEVGLEMNAEKTKYVLMSRHQNAGQTRNIKVKVMLSLLTGHEKLWDVEAPTFSTQLAHRRRWGCQLHVPAALYPQEDSWYSFLLEAEPTPRP
jgi:hypothetical protein